MWQFLDAGAPYVELRSRDGRWAVVKVEKGPCIGVSRELAIMLYPYYGWGVMDVEAYFGVSETRLVEATWVVMKVPFGIAEPVVRRQLTGFPIYEGTAGSTFLPVLRGLTSFIHFAFHVAGGSYRGPTRHTRRQNARQGGGSHHKTGPRPLTLS